MLRNVFLKSLWEQRRSLTWWAVGLTVAALLTTLFYPSFKDATDLNELLGDEDSFMRAFAGDIEDFTSPEGFLNSQLYFLLLPILLIIYTIASGSGAVAGEEEKGTLSLLMSHPLRRASLVLQKLGAMIVAFLALGFVLWLAVVIGALIVGMDIGLTRIAEATVSCVLLGTLFGTFALALGCATGRRGVAIGVSGAVCALGYLLNALRPVADVLEPTRFITPFYYYIEANPLSNGLDPMHAGVLVAVTALLALMAVLTFERRDMGS